MQEVLQILASWEKSVSNLQLILETFDDMFQASWWETFVLMCISPFINGEFFPGNVTAVLYMLNA